MAILNLPPTRSNLLKLKQDYLVASEGYELLERKREILVIELMSNIEKIKRLEKDIDKKLSEAYDSLKEAILNHGHEELNNVFQFINYEHDLKKKNVKLLGMNLPGIDIKIPLMKLQYSFYNTDINIDRVVKNFLGVIRMICEMAEIRGIVWRLSKEVKKTQRRVNALEKIVIPDTEDTLKFIQNTLEEKEREEMYVRKLIKQKLED